MSQRREHAGEGLQLQVFLVAQPVGAALDDTGLVVQSSKIPRGEPCCQAACGEFHWPYGRQDGLGARAVAVATPASASRSSSTFSSTLSMCSARAFYGSPL